MLNTHACTHINAHTYTNTHTSRVSNYLISEHHCYTELLSEPCKLSEELTELHLPSRQQEERGRRGEEKQEERRRRRGEERRRRGGREEKKGRRS